MYHSQKNMAKWEPQWGQYRLNGDMENRKSKEYDRDLNDICEGKWSKLGNGEEVSSCLSGNILS